jgi:TrmH family RNA methyltransferase
VTELISSHSNSLVRKIRSLRQQKGRKETGLFLVEGIHHFGEVIEAGWDIETVVYAPDLLTSKFALEQLEMLIRRGIHCAGLTGDLFKDIAGKDNPQGILAIIHQKRTALKSLSLADFTLGVACVTPQDPGNVGTILRTLDAVGADSLFLLDGGVELYHPSSVRASMGAIFWKPVIETSFDQFIYWVHSHQIYLVGSSSHSQVDYQASSRAKRPAILLLGSEQKGLSKEQMAVCDEVISLPMRGRVSSLNLAVAAGVLLYSLMAQQENKSRGTLDVPAK